ncbi:FAD-dependent oxidoreductase [Nocardioides caldifontis]|uniref:FAD-dependent oxidoreductase n=1 Tax=Nocardioides caldifontis TaxID=2588938 RepID=UPI0011E02ED2|nr:FAD-dependent oxidoreductase [Nocardioides caldifontis]
MAFAITQNCCNDATCVSVCPVNCIHPTPEEREFAESEMLYIDPKTCIDCGACADACPVEAIFPIQQLTGSDQVYADINAAYYENPTDSGAEERASSAADAGPNLHHWDPPVFDRILPPDFRAPRVAVVGTGPAGMYATQDLLLNTNAEVTLVDRLPVAGGLVRYGVAPDHPSTRGVGETFRRLHDHPRTRLYLNLEIGRDVTHEELAEHHDAVIYAVGATEDRWLGIDGEHLKGSISARRFVAWYNGHPDAADDDFDLSSERAVIVGNGNVALDVARILLSDPTELATTDIADHALAALRRSNVREVVLLGRRGPTEAAYTSPELLGLKQFAGVELVLDDHDPAVSDAVRSAGPRDKAALLLDVPHSRIDWSKPPEPGRRIVLRFHSAPTALLGDGEVEAIRVATGQVHTDLRTGMVARAIGYRGAPLPGLPFDERSATLPHDRGRVLDHVGTYVVGWAKRGPSGGIGTNRSDAHETVGTLIADAIDGRLRSPCQGARAFDRLVHRRVPQTVDSRGLAAIERRERDGGLAEGRPRVKLASVDELLATARRRRNSYR